MSIIETSHFLERWALRVGEYSFEFRKLIRESIEAGEARLHQNPEMGILVPVYLGRRNICVLGCSTEETFILKTCLTDTMAARLGWNR